MPWSERKKGWVMVGAFGSLLVMALAVPMARRIALRHALAEESFDSIEYRGQTFALTRKYADYEDYKDDPNNLAPGQEQKLEHAVANATIQRTYPNLRAMTRGVMALEFPGYGLSTFTRKQTDGSVLEGWTIEIPRASKCRCLVYRSVGQTGVVQSAFELIDDFVVADDPPIARVEAKDGRLHYSSRNGEPIVARFPMASEK